MHPFALRCLFTTVLIGPAIAQTTWIVAASGGGQFTDIAAAHDAAAPGDTLLVRPGSYLGFHRDPAKGLRILGDSAAAVTVTSPIWLANVPHGQQVHIGGLTIDARSNPWVSPTLAILVALQIDACPDFIVSAVSLLIHDGRTNWFEGLQLLAIYTILAIAFYFV